jgi:High-temperature-induced dauer-formation protein
MLAAIRHATITSVEPSAIRVHLFEWSPLSLGWYESLLWGFIFTSEMLVSKGTTGVWNGTLIKLFRVQETAAQTPSLLAPRGAVDAVGSNLVNRIGSLSLRGMGVGGSQRASNAGVSSGGERSSSVRDV